MMNKYGNLAIKERDEMVAHVSKGTWNNTDVSKKSGKTNLGLDCLKLLTERLEEPKSLAYDFKVGPKQVLRWKNGENKLSEDQALSIIKKTKNHMMNLSKLEFAIDEMLFNQFGYNVDKGVF